MNHMRGATLASSEREAVSNMGYRYMTQVEYTFIKELIKKYKGNLDKVAKNCGRSKSTLGYIKRSETFREYEKLRPSNGVKINQSKTTKENPFLSKSYAKKLEKAGEKAKAPAMDRTEAREHKQPRHYDGAILAQLTRTNNVLNRIEMNQSQMVHEYYLRENRIERSRRNRNTFISAIIMLGAIVAGAFLLM